MRVVPGKSAVVVIGVFCCFSSAAQGGAVVKRLFRSGDEQGENLLKSEAWRPWKVGFERRKDEQQREVFVCDNGADAKVQRGASQTVVLDQKSPAPIVATVWSKAEKVGGAPDSDYSLYLDLVYADGTPLWGQVAPFATGTHGWRKARVVVLPEKPVRSVTVNLLLRRHAGRVWFRDPVLVEKRAGAGMSLFDGDVVESVRPGFRGWMVRDMAKDSDYVAFENGEALGVRMKLADVTPDRPAWKSGAAKLFRAEFEALDPKQDRILSIVWVEPVGAGDWRWLFSPRKSMPAKPPGDYQRTVPVKAGKGGLSRYPFAAVCDADRGRALGLNLGHAAVFRAGFHAPGRELYLSFDIALTREKPKAAVGVCSFEFPPEWEFRAALQRYHELFPEFFACRVKRHGLWMPFHKISEVRGWQDFGFRFKEGTSETEWDDAHGILTFRYTEPMTWWMRMDAPMEKRSVSAAVAYAKALAKKGNPPALAWLSSAMTAEDGQFAVRLRDTPWCNGAVWSMNSAPGIPGKVTDFKLKWNPQTKARLYGPEHKGDLDGEYVDSSEGYATGALDFRRDHFAGMDTPLTWSASHQPAVFKGLVAYEYVRGLARDVHAMHKLMMANGTPGSLCWLAPWLDVMGTETNWHWNRRWSPMRDEDLLYRRSLCGPKPYCFLMNTNFDEFSHALVEKYMQRSLAFGMFPGFFSPNASQGHYFSRPELYNRDRDLFRKYIPLCRRLSEAGWQPVTLAHSSDPEVHVERFGGRYLTVFNGSSTSKTITIVLDLPQPARCTELLSGRTIEWRGSPPTASISLPLESLTVLDLAPEK